MMSFFRIEKKVWNRLFPKYPSLKSHSKFVIKLYVIYNMPTCQAHSIYYFSKNRTILDFRFSHKIWLSHICLKFERRYFKSLSHNFGASEEYELTSATSLWLNIAHALNTNIVKFKVLSLPFPFWPDCKAIPAYGLMMSVCLSVRSPVCLSVCLSTFWLTSALKFVLGHINHYRLDTLHGNRPWWDLLRCDLSLWPWPWLFLFKVI